MLKNNIYNIDREFDYSTIKAIVVKSLEKIIKVEELKNTSDIPDVVLFDYKGNVGNNNVKLSAPHIPLLKLKKNDECNSRDSQDIFNF
jgi:hypothetical protein